MTSLSMAILRRWAARTSCRASPNRHGATRFGKHADGSACLFGKERLGPQVIHRPEGLCAPGSRQRSLQKIRFVKGYNLSLRGAQRLLGDIATHPDRKRAVAKAIPPPKKACHTGRSGRERFDGMTACAPTSA